MDFYAYLLTDGQLALFKEPQEVAGNPPATYLGIVRLSLFHPADGMEMSSEEIERLVP